MKPFMLGLLVMAVVWVVLFNLPKEVTTLIVGGIGGWQIGTWAWEIGLRLSKHW